MKKILVIAVALACVLASASALAQDRKRPLPASAEPMIGQLIVKLRAPTAAERVQRLGAQRAAALSKSASVALEPVRAMSGDATVVRLPQAMPLAQALQVVERLRADPAVEWAVPDLPVRRQHAYPVDAGFATNQWNLFHPSTQFTAPTVGSGFKTHMPAGGASLPPAWAITLGDAQVTVAVIDTGVVSSQRDLAGRLLKGYDFISSNALTSLGVPPNFVANDGGGRDADASDPGDWVTADEEARYPAACAGAQTDSSWHGTHMSGIIAANWGNDFDPATGQLYPGTRTAGIAPQVRILPVRVLGKCGGLSSDVIDGMRWAAGLPVPGAPANPTPARVLNVSLGGSAGACNQAYSRATQDIQATGAVIVAAAGNEATEAALQPANCAGVISVTAHAINGDNADYANVARRSNPSEVTISAPGGGLPTSLPAQPALLATDNAYLIWSTGLFGATIPTSTASASDLRRGDAVLGLVGTSPATAHVSAAVALMLSADPSLSATRIRGLLTATARPHPAGGYCAQGNPGAGLCGAGLLDVGAALAAVAPPPPPSGAGALPLPSLLLLALLSLVSGVRRSGLAS